MRLLQIDYFLAVAETLNFTSAASQLYISQPALSKQIALLEKELGVKLFYRSSRKVELTEAGRQFETDLRDIRGQLEQAKKRVMQMGGTAVPQFRMACYDGAAVDDFLPQIFELFRRKLPGTEVSLFRGNFPENWKALDEGNADLLLTLDTGDLQHESCTVKHLFKRNAALIYSKRSALAGKDALTISDFDSELFLILPEKMDISLYRMGMKNLRLLGIQPERILEEENFVTLLTDLSVGKGFALLTEEVAEQRPGLCAYRLDDSYGVDVVAMWKKTHVLAAKMEHWLTASELQEQ